MSKLFRVCDGSEVLGSFGTQKAAEGYLKVSTLTYNGVTKPLAECGFKVEKLGEDGWVPAGKARLPFYEGANWKRNSWDALGRKLQ